MLKRFREIWRGVALLTFNLLIALGLANLLAFLVLLAVPAATGPELDPLLLAEAYPGRTPAEIRRIQSETWGREYVYEPFTQFKEGTVTGDFVNVSESGFRLPPGGAPWPPDPATPNVFVFGGSTTFGYGLADDETIPSCLERHLRRSPGCAQVAVYNLARSNYYSTQERILFAQLLAAGRVPRAAVFIDGLNEFGYLADEPKFTRRLEYLMAERPGQLDLRALKTTPLARLLRRARPSIRTQAGDETKATPAWSEEELAGILNRWRSNRRLIRAIAKEYSVDVTFVVQPVPSFDLDLSEHPFLAPGRSPDPRTGLPHAGYQMALEQLGKLPGDRQLWLGDGHRLIDPPHYVDRVHYSAAFSSAIADRIAGSLRPNLCGEGQT